MGITEVALTHFCPAQEKKTFRNTQIGYVCITFFIFVYWIFCDYSTFTERSLEMCNYFREKYFLGTCLRNRVPTFRMWMIRNLIVLGYNGAHSSSNVKSIERNDLCKV